MNTLDSEGMELAAALQEHAPRAPGMEPHLHAAITQTATALGSLLRARLVLSAARSHELPEAVALPLACAVEYFHAASLILDDLPCMDDATVRRGQACVHRVHGDATAILAALAFINRAHVLIGLAYAAHAPAVRVRTALLLDDTLGLAGLVGGQARDLRFGEGATDRREIAVIAAGKTGALFKLALILPALAVEPSAAEFRLLKALAVYWGQWFQACDDMKDVIGTLMNAGKDTGRDQALSRPNLVNALGPGAAQRRIDRLERQLARTSRNLQALGARWNYLAEFHAAITGRARARAA
ncbi:polyprenyl synthetase family protein [Oleiharenicola lentus]|jgi:geranylgeranyl pyrophosphate synthase|uniref:Polyprenyl synthetase family protein n=1 Tax=Oleiharenicola lentus TaxID=2508720 RepID=A0A4Q1C3G7_9BACT|nr:polyprenyl synthetase family protein [Oleiharenicola lentus]RXK52871.1 polyprenyl synthetase family protein [Oleiharenicola lentus]